MTLFAVTFHDSHPLHIYARRCRGTLRIIVARLLMRRALSAADFLIGRLARPANTKTRKQTKGMERSLRLETLIMLLVDTSLSRLTIVLWKRGYNLRN